MANLLTTPRELLEQLKSEMRYVNDFLMDTENWILQNKWPYRMTQGDAYEHHPTGSWRYEHPEWGRLMKEALANPEGRITRRITWDVYCAWCQSGLGEEWMTEEDAT